MGKAFYISDINKNAVGLSLEEALAKKMTNWMGWQCAAGHDNIHVTSDGDIYAATCKVGGLLANVFDSFGGLSGRWIQCTKAVCACGSDMQLKKSKNPDNIPLMEKMKTSDVSFVENIEESDREFVGPVFDDNRPTCTWDLGRRCNYNCDYCNDSISNNYEAHKSFGSLEHAYSKIKRIFCRERPSKFIFTGGEPTINPNYLKLVQRIHADGHLVHTQTNGSLTPEYYSELIKYSFIGISVHLKFYNKARLLKNLHAIVATKNSGDSYKFHWVGIRIMAPPGKGDEAVQLYEELNSTFKFGGEDNTNIHLCHTYEKNDAEKLQEYSREEFDLIQRYT